ncbi:MAG: cell division topological specificity factor MinE [Syntrophomonadaceae bacterium]|nr:cell division topological specificity factor MinE [Syntrophomonadaceae bacterium]
MFDLISKLFYRENMTSRDIAKERLRLVLVHDRSSSSPELLNALKEDLIRVIREYMEIDEDALVVDLANEDDAVALIANIPVKGFRRAVNQ